MLVAYSIAVLLAISASISWGINSHILKIGARDENPMLALTYRAIVSLPILIVILWSIEGLNDLSVYLTGNLPIQVSLLVLSIAFGDGLFIYALKNHRVNVILPIASTYPLVTTIFLIVTRQEQVTFLVVLGTILTVIGIIIVTSKGSYILEITHEALVLGFGVAVAWGMSVYFAKLILDHDKTEAVGLMVVRTLLVGLAGLFLFLINFQEIKRFRKRANSEKIRSFKYFGLSGIFGWVLGATFLFLAIKAIGAAIPTPISSTNPIIAAVIGQTSGIEKINKEQFLGIVISTIGVITILI